MMIDLVLIHPSDQGDIYGDLSKEFTAIEPPKWARFIAGYVRDQGYRVEIIDMGALGLNASAVAYKVENLNPRFVAIYVEGSQPSASTQCMPCAGKVAAAIKLRDPWRRIVMLGNHPSALPEQTLQDETVNYVIDGEGPRSIEALLQGERVEYVPGLVWHHKGKVTFNPLAPLIEDLDKDLHGNTWDLLPMEKYRAHTWQCFGDLKQRKSYASIYTTLGCPHKCNFCMINVFQHTNKYRCFSPRLIVDKIEMLYRQHGVKTFKFADEMFILKEAHYSSICQELIARNLGKKINIWAYARVDTVKPHTLSMLRSAGFRWLALGIESGNKAVRDGADKHLKTDDIVGIVRKVQEAGISVIGNFMFGFSDDSMQTMHETLDLAMECMPEFANFYVTQAYPGSPLYNEAIKKDWTLPSSWAGYSQHGKDCRPLDTQHVDAATVVRFRDNAFNTYFSDPRYHNMIHRKFGQQAVDHINDMLKYKLPRRILSNQIELPFEMATL